MFKPGTVGFVSRAKLLPWALYLPFSYRTLDKSQFWELSHPQTLTPPFASSSTEVQVLSGFKREREDKFFRFVIVSWERDLA